MTITNQIVSFKLSGISYSGTSTQLNSTAGVTPGTCAASKTLVVDSFRSITNINSLTATSLIATGSITGTLATAAQPNITSIGTLTNLSVSNNLTISGHNGSTIGLILGSTLVTATGAQLNYNDITAVGTAQALKSLVLDSSSNIIGINSLTSTTLVSTNLTLNGVVITANGNQLNYNNITTPGVAQVSRSLVLNSSGNISGINSLSTTNLTATGTITGTLAAGAQTGITELGTLTSLTLNGPITGVTTLATSGNITCGGNLTATNLSGTLTTSSQPNITSVGTLGSLSVTGQITSGTINSTNIFVNNVDITTSLNNLGNISGVTPGTALASKALILDASRNITNINTLTSTSLSATNITGTLQTASQPNITQLGELTTLAIGGSITKLTNITMTGSISGANTISATSFQGTISTASQGSITSLGVLTGLSINGNLGIGIGSASPSRQLEINNSTGSCLRLSHNAPTGSATNFTDFTLNSSGALTVNSSNNLINLQSHVVIGKGTTSNVLYFNGVNGDTGINSTVIAERLYNSNTADFSELLLFKGNDQTGLYGPDRIRMRAGELRFQIIDVGEDFTTLADDNDALIISSDGKLGINCSSPSQQLEINNATGNCLRLIYNNTANNADINVNISGTLNIKSSNNTVLIGDSTTTSNQTLLIGTFASTGTAGIIRILNTSAGNYLQSAVNNTNGSAADLIIGNYAHNISTSLRKIIFKADGKVGFGTSAPTRQLEINDSNGDCLRLTYNDSAGSATAYLDQSVSSSGVSTFTAVGTSPGFVFAGINAAVSINNILPSTGSTNGALQVAGGAYFGANSLMAANLTLSGTSSTLSLSGTSSFISLRNTTASTSSSTGALQVAGGAYFGANTLMAANLTLSGTSSTLSLSGASAVLSISNTAASTSSTTGALRVTGGAYFGANSLCAGILSISNSTGSNNTTSGALQVTGGVGIGGAVNIGGAVSMANNVTLSGTSNSLSLSGASAFLSISNTTASTSSSTGALRVSGGIYVGANSFMYGTLTLDGNNTGSGRVMIYNNTLGFSHTNGGNELTTYANSSNVGFGSYSNCDLLFYSNNTARMTLSASGNLTLSGASAVLSISNTAASTSSSTGALRVSGGAYFGTGCLFNNIIDGNGSVRSTGYTPPASGSGIEMHYASSTASLFGYNRSAPQFLPLSLNNTIFITGGASNGPFTTSIGTGVASGGYILEVGATNQSITGNYGYLSTTTTGSVVSGSTGSVSFSAKFNGRINVAGEVDVTSDRRIKEKIREINQDECDKFVNTIKPVHFKYKKQDKEAYGYIAQDILRAGFNNIVQVHKDDNLEEEIDEDGFVNPKGHVFTVAYDEIPAILHQYILKQDVKINEQSDKIKSLEQELEEIKKSIEYLLKKD